MQIGTGEEILTNPANHYIRTFLEDVDRSKVLTAESAMVRPITLNTEHDGPKVALQRMREEEVSVLLATNRQKEFLGYITADDALKAAKDGVSSITSYVRTDMPTVEPATLLQDLLSTMSDSPTPIAVVENHRLRGILIRGVVLEALSSSEEVKINE